MRSEAELEAKLEAEAGLATLAMPEPAAAEEEEEDVMVVVFFCANRSKASDISDPSKNTWGFAVRYLPLPQPTSNPTEPGD